MNKIIFSNNVNNKNPYAILKNGDKSHGYQNSAFTTVKSAYEDGISLDKRFNESSNQG